MAMVKRTAEFLKEQQKQGLEKAKKGAEYLKEASSRVSDSLPKWEEGYRGYHHKFHEYIAVMVGGSRISVYCTYCYLFKNVEKEVSVLKTTLEEVEKKAVRVDKGLALSRAIATKKGKGASPIENGDQEESRGARRDQEESRGAGEGICSLQRESGQAHSRNDKFEKGERGSKTSSSSDVFK